MVNEFDYIMQISETFEPGKWIAAIGNDIVIGESAGEVLEKIRSRHSTKEPFVMKVPYDSVMLF